MEKLLIDVRSRPWQTIILTMSKDDLEQLQPTGPERSDRAIQVQSPHSDKIRIKHLIDVRCI
jgi:hypothetical protein